MKNPVKIITSLLLSTSIAVSVVPSINANSATEMWLDGEENGFQYSIQLNYGYVVINSCDADKTGVVEIPSEISGSPVTTIRRGAFTGCGKTDEEYKADEYYDETTATHGYSGCGITEIIIPDSVTTIEDFAFQDCESLTKIHFPAGLKDFYGTENNRFYGECIGYDSWVKGCDSLKELTISENNPYFKSVNGIIYSKDGKTIGPVPPAVSFDSINFDGISAIGAFAFSGRENQMSDIEIPSHITSIGDYAFCDYGGYGENNEGTVNIKLNQGLTSIGDYAFAKIHCLEEINLPDSVTSIGKGAFSSDNRLKSIAIPPKVTVISDELFYCCYNLTSVKLPEGITEIGKYAFYGPLYLTSIDLPSTLKKIDDYAFALFSYNDKYSRKGLTSIEIPDSVEYIGQYAFENNKSLKSVKLSKNLKKIESYSFSSCGIDSLEIPEGVTEIDDNAFSYNPLTSLKLPDTLLRIGNEAFRTGFVYDIQKGNKSVVIPDSVNEIGSWAFAMCHLNDIKLPDKAVSCGLFAFSGNNLSSVIFPEGTESLTLPLIWGNENVNRIYLPRSLKELSPLGIAKNGYFRLVALGTPYDVGSYEFNNLVMVEDIYFAGTESEWNELIKDWNFEEYYTDSSVMDNVTVHFNSADIESDVAGDVNADGKFNIADIIMMQRYIMYQGRILNWEAGDINKDGIINVFDLCSMKNMLIQTLPSFKVSVTNLVWDSENRTVTADVTYENLPENSDIWIGIVPSDTPHDEEQAYNARIDYEYFSGFESGNFNGFTLNDSGLSGNYDIRVYNNNKGGREMACITFHIDGPKADIQNLKWDSENRTVTADVTYQGLPEDNNAWIGVVPSDTPHNENEADYEDVVYTSLRNFKSGNFEGLKVPDNISGNYDLRIYGSDYGGAELACVSFTIE